MRAENPFRGWLTRDVYGGFWVPVAQLGGLLGPAACPALVRDAKEAILASTEWPLQFDAARPRVWHTWGDGEPTREADLHPTEQEDGVSYTPFVVIFDPFGSPAWLEPVQPFVLYWNAWPATTPAATSAGTTRPTTLGQRRSPAGATSSTTRRARSACLRCAATD